MRIVKNGLEETEVECPECSSRLAYTPNDVYFNDTEEIMGIYVMENCITCPVCKHKIVLRRSYFTL